MKYPQKIKVESGDNRDIKVKVKIKEQVTF